MGYGLWAARCLACPADCLLKRRGGGGVSGGLRPRAARCRAYLVGCLFGRVSGAVSGGLRLRGIPPPRVFGGLSVGARREVRVRRTPENACVRVRVRANARVRTRACECACANACVSGGLRRTRACECACVRMRACHVPMHTIAPLEIENEFKIEIRIEVGNET